MCFHQLNNNKVLSQVRKLTAENKIEWTLHSEEKLAERSIGKDEVRECLLKGFFFKEFPIISTKSAEINYAFLMRARVEGQFLNVKASLYPEKKVLVITTF